LSANTRLEGALHGNRQRRLESWKAIARYLDRDVRSVQRWEHERGLPVHRTPGQKGSVFAYESELDTWLHSRGSEDAVAAAEAHPAPSAKPIQWPPWLIGACLVAPVLVVTAAIVLLRGPGPSAPAVRPAMKSIAVLPMVNLSGDRSQDYFVDGFTEELTTDLSQIRALRVISRTSTMVYKGSRKPLPEIARELHAKYILEGSVAREGPRVRVIAQLISAASDTHISARTYYADVKDVLSVQGAISRAIAGDVRLDLSPDEKARLVSARAVDPAAHDLYLRASSAYAAQTPQSIHESLSLYQAAAHKDPRFARAYLGIALAELALLQITAQTPDVTVRQVKENAERALALDPGLGDARGLLASMTYNYDWNWPEAERQFRLALADGAQAPTEQRFGAALTSRGRFAEGMAHLETAIELDPLGMSPRVNWLIALLNERRYAEARKEAERLLASAPKFLAGHVLRLSAAGFEHDCAVEGSEAAWIGQHFPSPMAKVVSAFANACRGDKVAARQSLDSIEASKASPFASPYQLALGYAVIGDKDMALRYLNSSADIHEPQVLFLKVEPVFDALRSDPRFVALERRLGLLP
jgi:TolB-like protein